MGFPVGEIQAATVARLRGDTTLQGLLVGASAPDWNIYDANGVPINQTFPYIAAFPVTNKKGTAFAFGSDSIDTVMQISIFTQASGFAKARAIAKQVYSLMDQKALTLTGGFRNFSVLFDNSVEVPEKDGLTQQVALKFQLKTQG